MKEVDFRYFVSWSLSGFSFQDDFGHVRNVAELIRMLLDSSDNARKNRWWIERNRWHTLCGERDDVNRILKLFQSVNQTTSFDVFFALRRETKKRQLSLRERMESTRSCFRERKRRKGKCRRDLSSIPVIKIWKEIIYGSERIRFSRNFKLVVADHETKRHAYATLFSRVAERSDYNFRRRSTWKTTNYERVSVIERIMK